MSTEAPLQPAEAAPQMQRTAKSPDFFIVGHAKCGTTALYEMLRGHPEIYMPELKEPAYFAGDLRNRFQRAAAGRLPQTLTEYLALFADAKAGQRVGEASSGYLASVEAPSNIARVRPDAKIIAILREPASFLRSLHLQLLQDHTETEKDLRRALELEPLRRRGKRIPRRSPRPQALLYSERVRYVEQLRRYHAHFPREQVLVSIYDDLRRDNEATVRRVLGFLQVDDTLAIAASEANPTVRMRSQQLDDLMYAVSVGRGPVSRGAKRAIKALAPGELRRAGLRTVRRRVVLGRPQPPDEGLMRELRRRFEPEVAALSEYLDRDLVSLWDYERVT